MANIVGGLAVLLGLDATEYIRGLTKAEQQAKQFARNTKSAISEVEKEIAKLGIATLILDRTRAIIAEAAALNDLADATGSSVESLSRLNNQVKISGGDINSMNDAVLKLAAGMSGADSKGSKVNETLKLLGITAKDPVEALQQVALKLNTYADGVNKVGLAQALFGKSGREFLKTLQDVAELQDVQATVTAKQAQEAEALEKSWRALSATATGFSNAILSDLVPAMERLLRLTRESGGAGLFAAMGLTPEDTADAREALKETAENLVDLKRKRDAFTTQGAIVKLFSFDDIAILNKQIAVAEARQNELRRIVNAQYLPRDIKPEAPKPPPAGGAGGGGRTRALKEATDEGLRYQQSLEKQLRATMELSHEEEARFAIFDALRKGQAGFTDEVQANIINLARQLDITEELKKAEQERLKLAADEARIRERISNTKTRGIEQLNAETEALAQGNDQMRQEIEAIGLDATSLAQLTMKRLEDAAAAKEQTAAMYRNAGGMEAEAAALENQARILRERKGLVLEKGVAEQMEADLAKAKEINDLFAASFADAAKSIIKNTDSIAGAFKKMGQRISDALLDMALDNIAKSLFGAPTSSGGGGIFGGIGAAIMGSIFGGGSSSGYGMNVRASGGPVAANQPYVVGERGPELFMPKTAGTIIPNSQTGRGNFVFNINVPAGATRSTIEQTQLKFGMALQSVMDRNG